MPKENSKSKKSSSPPVKIETKVTEGGRVRPRAGAFVKVIGPNGEIKEHRRIVG
jgi:hypothetical protein